MRATRSRTSFIPGRLGFILRVKIFPGSAGSVSPVIFGFIPRPAVPGYQISYSSRVLRCLVLYSPTLAGALSIDDSVCVSTLSVTVLPTYALFPMQELRRDDGRDQSQESQSSSPHRQEGGTQSCELLREVFHVQLVESSAGCALAAWKSCTFSNDHLSIKCPIVKDCEDCVLGCAHYTIICSL